MNKYKAIGILTLSVVFLFCGKSKNPVGKSTDIQYKTFQSSCKSGSTIEITKKAYTGPVSISSHKDTIIVTQYDVLFNCCSRIEVNITRTSNGFDLREKDIGQTCKCNCLFDIQTLICKLEDGSYYIRVYDPNGKCVGSSTVDIPAKYSVSGSIQSECKNKLNKIKADEPQVDSLVDSITFNFRGDTVEITHRNACYNCCSKLGTNVQPTIDGFNIYESDTAKDWCFCICHFDLTTTICEISPGDYIVRVFDTAGDLVGEIAFKFPPT